MAGSFYLSVFRGSGGRCPLQSLRFGMALGVFDKAGALCFPRSCAAQSVRGSFWGGTRRPIPSGKAPMRGPGGMPPASGIRARSGKFLAQFVTILDKFGTIPSGFAPKRSGSGAKSQFLVQFSGQDLGFRCKIPVSGAIPVILSDQNLGITLQECGAFFRTIDSGVLPAGMPSTLGLRSAARRFAESCASTPHTAR